MAAVQTEVAGGWLSPAGGESKGMRTRGPGTNKRGCAMAMVGAMGIDDGRRLTADRRPVGSTGQQQQVQKRVVAASTRNPNPSPDPTR